MIILILKNSALIKGGKDLTNKSDGSLSLKCWLRGVMNSFMIEYLGEIETELEIILAFSSGAQMVFNHDKFVIHNRVTYSL